MIPLCGGLPCLSLCVGGKWEGTLYLYDRKIETLLEKICHFVVCGSRGAIWMDWTLVSGYHPLVAVYMSEFLGGPTRLSLPVSRGLWPEVFNTAWFNALIVGFIY